MLNHPTLQLMVELKLKGFCQAYREQIDSGQYREMSFDDRLALLLERESLERQSAALKRRLSNAKFRQQACLEDVKVSYDRGVDQNLLNQLQSCQWVRQGQNIIVTGPSGVGKTYLATSLAHKACQIGFSSRYYRCSHLISELAESKLQGKYRRTIEKLGKIQVLILDDWLLSQIGEEEQKHLFELIDERSPKHSTIITSQNPVSSWHSLMPNAAIADALLDRLVHGGHRVELKGESMRKAKSTQVDKEEV